MANPEWQSKDPMGPNFLRVCRAECAISKPDDVLVTKDSSIFDASTWRRGAIYDEIRRLRAKSLGDIVEVHQWGFLPDPQDEPELYEKAERCINTVRTGHCSINIIVSDPRYNDEMRLMSRALASTLGIAVQQ